MEHKKFKTIYRIFRYTIEFSFYKKKRRKSPINNLLLRIQRGVAMQEYSSNSPDRIKANLHRPLRVKMRKLFNSRVGIYIV